MQDDTQRYWDEKAQKGKDAAASAGNALLRVALRKVMAWLGPVLAAASPVIAIVLAILAGLLLLLAVILYVMPSAGYMTGPVASPEDAAITGQAKDIARRYNVMNTWQYAPWVSTPGQPGYGEPDKSHPFYPNAGSINLHNDQIDKNGLDYPQALTWGMVHGIDLFWAMEFDRTAARSDMDRFAALVKPYFYYKKSGVIVTTSSKGGSSTSVSYVYLLVESDTLYGHYQYHYRWKTDVSTSKDGSTTVQYEVLDHTVTLATWQRFDAVLEEILHNKGNSLDSIAMARSAIVQMAAGFVGHRSVWEWLAENPGSDLINGPILQVTSQEIEYKPIANPQGVIAFLKAHDSALAESQYLDVLDEEGRAGNINPLLLLAITGQEQGFVPTYYSDWPQVIRNPYNVYGSWQDYQPGTDSLSGFTISTSVAVHTLAALAQGCPPGENVIEWINGFGSDGARDNPRWGYAGDPDWWVGVSRFYQQLGVIGD